MKHNILLAFILVCNLVFALRAEPLAWETQNPQLLDTAKLRQTATQVTTARFPDADEVQLDRDTFVRYEQDGTWFQVMDMASKILTEKGVEENRVISSWYTASTSRAKISLVQLLKSNGNIVDIDLAKMGFTV